ncbi:MAG: ElyC/SanA/YdcF family protein [Aulosira sp. ZfuVER01]|nr:ElyC/SanA/YdcF family protein [Aulosira sp. ZfuVER01]MDZ8001896.1 ElyC/SanA/YdcF family protein [Aulosira sp. DedVER01a]MDZ8056578.1 ElyC/SanA/YdcF family protein [Aulosira sp. ZfuCHP01]
MQKRKNRWRLKLPKFRLIKRQEMWILTVQGWIIAIALIAALIIFAITHIHPFLAVTSPIKSAEILVVEGWLPDYALQQAVAEFKSGNYRQIITTGGTLEQGAYLTAYNSFADVAAATLKKFGLESEKVVAVPAPYVIKDRSYTSAAEFGRWLSKSNFQPKSINLFSWDAHTRRSWLLFKKVLAPQMKVGAIAAKTQDYNPKQWWRSSQGVRTVIDEAIAYIYAQFFNWKA